MPRKKQAKRCQFCARLYTELSGKPSCWFSGKVLTPKKKACKNFKAGPPFVPSFDGRMSKVVNFDPEKTTSWTFYTSPNQCLVLTWDAKAYCWRTHAVGINDEGGLTSKQFGPEEHSVAFNAQIEVVGAEGNSLFTSSPVTHEDEIDEDGLVTNKPKVLVIHPQRPRRTED